MTKKTALLLNDTSQWYHWGCHGTSLGLHKQIQALGYSLQLLLTTFTYGFQPFPDKLTDFDSEKLFNQFKKNYPDIANAIDNANVVLINGEGSIHGLTKTSIGLLYLAYLCKNFFKKNTQIINHSAYPPIYADSPKIRETAKLLYQKVYQTLDFVAIRCNVPQ